MVHLHSHLSSLSRVGKTIAQRLKKLGLETAQDLIFYLPWRYENFGQKVAISSLQDNSLANIVGQVDLIQNKRSFKRKMNITEALIKDESGFIKVIWFNQPFIAKNIHIGDTISLAGKIKIQNNQPTIISPIYEKIKESDNNLIHTQNLSPIYSTTNNLSQKQIRFLISQVIPLTDKIVDWLPDKIQRKIKLLPLSKAIHQIHFPKNEEELIAAKKRFGFTELFLRQIQSQITKKELKKSKAIKIKFQEKLTKNFISKLPFSMTVDQKKSAWTILQDIEKEIPMSRLLQGDVGSGKTLVAIIALLNTAKNKQRAIIMAPTEILARQHYQTIIDLLKNENVTVGLITNSQKEINFPLEIKNKNKISQKIIDNSQIIIGTHALIQKGLIFENLALVVVDEQHRFGVEQRQKLLLNSTKETPHFLSMTATPIPRSLSLAIYGDLDISLIKEKPKNRLPIITRLIKNSERIKAYQFIIQEIKKGRQIFVVCPLIDPSDKLGVKSVKEEFEKLDKEIFPDIKIGLLHGKMKGKEKEEIMQNFLDNKIKILVATSVIEVGIDIPNASIMMIEGAERFGLAQLHQFRGRVGRDAHQSYCFLFTDKDNKKTEERLKALINNSDGFLLAKEDLKLRGSGEIYGTIQSGYPEIRIASLFDTELIKKAQEEATNLINQDPSLRKNPLLKKKLEEFNKIIHLE